MKALMDINGRLVNPFLIKKITKSGGWRSRRDWEGNRRYHPMIKHFIGQKPWIFRWLLHLSYPPGHFVPPYITVHLSNDFVEIKCKSKAHRDGWHKQLLREWDDSLAKFQGTDCKFELPV